MRLENMENTHPGTKEGLEEKGLSVCQNSLNVRQSIDGAGEQTFIKSAKSTGGIKNFITHGMFLPGYSMQDLLMPF